MDKHRHVGDVIGISRAHAQKRVKPPAPRRRRRVAGIEVNVHRFRLKPARVIGGVRGIGH